jgi:Family of unknown function (DUF6441)
MAAAVEFSLARNAVRNTFREMKGAVAHAATAAMDTTVTEVSTGGRGVIRAAGFSKKWQNGWRVRRYPVKGDSLDPAIWAFHKIPYAAVFQDGATIKGSPLLWLPLPTAPKIGRKKMTAALYIKSIGPLHRINRPGKAPLLAGYVRSFSKAGKATVARLKGGEKRRRERGTRGLISVPMFVGIPQAKIRKRFNFSPMWRKALATLSAQYARNLRG